MTQRAKQNVRSVVLTLVLIGTAAIVLILSGPRRAEPAGGYPPINEPVTAGRYLVLARNAPAWMRAQFAQHAGRGVYLCDGTSTTGGDQVELQAAIDATDLDGDGNWDEAGDGGVIEIVGRLYYSDPTGETAWAGTGTTATVSSKTVITVTAWTTGTIADVNVGEVLRISQTAGGTDPATEHDDLVYTVYAVDAKLGTITLHSHLTADYAGLGINFTRILAAVEVPSNIKIRGSASGAARFSAIPAATCSGILVTGYTTTLESFDIRDAVLPAAYDGRRNGVILADGAFDCVIRDVFVVGVQGDGFVFNEGHDCYLLENSLTENCWGRGVVSVGTSELTIGKIVNGGKYKDALLAHRSTRMLVDGMIAKNYAGYGVLLRSCSACIVTNCRLMDDTGASGLIYAYASDQLQVKDNDLYVAYNAVPAITLHGYCTYGSVCGNVCRLTAGNSTGIVLSQASRNTVVGNIVYPVGTGAVAFNQEYAFYGNNDIFGNPGALPSNECRVIRGTNTSGASIAQWDAVCRRTSGVNEIEQATVAAATRFLGVCNEAAIADAASGLIQTEGHCETAEVDGTDNVAVGDALSLDDTNGAFQKAVSTEIAVAIAEEARTADSVGVQDIYILPPGQRYTMP